MSGSGEPRSRQHDHEFDRAHKHSQALSAAKDLMAIANGMPVEAQAGERVFLTLPLVRVCYTVSDGARR